ncbi:hypothetical protein BJ085DRAFT_29321 [Dimargaris cristalligena]|uniref:Uncharacterized protein n=1 Tax=Dimargaris cristalligena TaxID=215637 RepID=A0A4P9ZYE3_9FUNG|nr:hypothetical protein BJ085DRAFT_29321 [Dimargaris cristalligena]|eukprot:RKP37952.1 hypothetical protein BJ085DRAFT_29321 [Dimargaris cristalligena]
MLLGLKPFLAALAVTFGLGPIQPGSAFSTEPSTHHLARRSFHLYKSEAFYEDPETGAILGISASENIPKTRTERATEKMKDTAHIVKKKAKRIGKKIIRQ